MDYKPEEAMMIKLDYELPEYPTFVEGIRRAPHARIPPHPGR